MFDFGLLPPEINSGRMYAGPGSGTMMAAAAGWDALAAELDSGAAGYSSVVATLTGSPWVGPASALMVASVTPYVSWMSATAAQAEQAGMQARTAAAAYEAAFAMTVPPPVIAANRVLLQALIATNFFGQNTAAIAATEAQYAEMWAQDANAMYGYAASSAAATVLTAFQEPPKTTSPAGVDAQSAAVDQATATPAGTTASTVASAVSAATSPVTATPLTATPAASVLNPYFQVLSEWLSPFLGYLNPSQLLNISVGMRTFLLRNLDGLPYFSLGMGQFGVAIGQQMVNGLGTTAGAQGAWFPTPQFAALGAGGWTTHVPAGISGGLSANTASAVKIGGLSVPSSWSGATSPSGPSGISAETVGYGGGGLGASGAGTQGLLGGMPTTGSGWRGGRFITRYGSELLTAS